MKVILVILFSIFLCACAGSKVQTTTTDASGQTTTTTTIDITKSEGAVATHNDLLGAANVATAAAAATTDKALKAALTARANWWIQQDAMLTARENQVSACLNAIAAMKPNLPAASTSTAPHVFTDVEIAAEAVGNFSGITPAVKLACAPLPIPPLPVLPKP